MGPRPRSMCEEHDRISGDRPMAYDGLILCLATWERFPYYLPGAGCAWLGYAAARAPGEGGGWLFSGRMHGRCHVSTALGHSRPQLPGQIIQPPSYLLVRAAVGKATEFVLVIEAEVLPVIVGRGAAARLPRPPL